MGLDRSALFLLLLCDDLYGVREELESLGSLAWKEGVRARIRAGLRVRVNGER